MEEKKNDTITISPTGPKVAQIATRKGWLVPFVKPASRALSVIAPIKNAISVAVGFLRKPKVAAASSTLVLAFVAHLIVANISTGFGHLATMMMMGVGGETTIVSSGGGGGGYTGPGDIVSGASAWWGLRAYNTAYATALGNIAIIVDTATGLASCTMVAKANGDADLTSASCVSGTVSVTTFCTVTHVAGCSVQQLYDQTGNGIHLQNSTVANMPTFVLGSVSGLASNRPSMIFVSASSQLLASALTLTQALGVTLISTSFRSGTSTTATVLGTDVANNPEMGYQNTAQAFIYNGSFSSPQTATDNAWHSLAGVFNAGGTASFVNVDGISGSTANIGSTGFTGGHLRIGTDPFSQFLNGNVQEGGIWPSSLTGTQISNLYNGTGGAKPYWGF